MAVQLLGVGRQRAEVRRSKRMREQAAAILRANVHLQVQLARWRRTANALKASERRLQAVDEATVVDRQQVEEQLAALRNQLAHACRLGTLGEMAAGLAHELNQPLAALRLYATAVRELVPADNSPELREYLARIDDQSHRASEIIRRMRSFASPHPFRRGPADLNQLVREVLWILENDLRQALVVPQTELAPDLPATSVDAIQLQQILVNLIRNAIDAMDEPGNDERRLLVRTCCDETSIRVSVTDTGCGIAPAAAANLFQPFHSTKPEGLGLGLSICRTLVEAHGGSIAAEPNATRGSTFFLVLPRQSTC